MDALQDSFTGLPGKMRLNSEVELRLDSIMILWIMIFEVNCGWFKKHWKLNLASIPSNITHTKKEKNKT